MNEEESNVVGEVAEQYGLDYVVSQCDADAMCTLHEFFCYLQALAASSLQHTYAGALRDKDLLASSWDGRTYS
jgi:hypothetical protein